MGKSQVLVKEREEYTTEKKLQNLAIKKRLADYYHSLDDNVRPSIYALQSILSNMPNGFTVSYNTLNDMLSEARTDKAPNLYLVLALCRYWQLDYAAILAPPEAEPKVLPSMDALVAKAQLLEDEGYMGTFHGYVYSRNISKMDVLKFELEIGVRGDTTVATMTVHNNTSDVNGENISYPDIYTGTPILLTKKNVIVMTLVDDAGNFYSLYLNYRHYKKLGLYYRKGIAVTTESGSDNPMLNNFVLFKEAIEKEEARRLIPGLLPLIGDSFYIAKEELQKLEQEEEMRSFFADYSYNWSGRESTVYRIRVSHVLKSLEDENDEQERFRVLNALIRLQENAQAPVRIEYENPDGMAGFAKIVMQGQ